MLALFFRRRCRRCWWPSASDPACAVRRRICGGWRQAAAGGPHGCAQHMTGSAADGRSLLPAPPTAVQKRTRQAPSERRSRCPSPPTPALPAPADQAAPFAAPAVPGTAVLQLCVCVSLNDHRQITFFELNAPEQHPPPPRLIANR